MRNSLWWIIVAHLVAQCYTQQIPPTVRGQSDQQSLLNQSQHYLAALQAALVSPNTVTSTKPLSSANNASTPSRAANTPVAETAVPPPSAVKLEDVKHCFGCRQLSAECPGSQLVCVSESIFNISLAGSEQDPSYNGILSDLITNGLSCRTLPSAAAECADVVPADYSLLFNYKVCCEEVQQAELVYSADSDTPAIGINGSKKGLLPVYSSKHNATAVAGSSATGPPQLTVSNTARAPVPVRPVSTLVALGVVLSLLLC